MPPFDFQPRLEGSLVALRPLATDDYEPLLRAASDPLIWEQLPGVERHRPQEFQEFFSESMALESALVIIERESGNIVGSSRYARYCENTSEVEIGWTFLSRECWGKGHNLESKLLMLEHAFRYVDSIFFVAALANKRSIRAIEKLGAVRETTMKWPPDAIIQESSVMYRITRSVWIDIRAGNG